MAKLRCKQTVVYEQKQILHITFRCKVFPESINTGRRQHYFVKVQAIFLTDDDSIYFFEFLSPSNSRHLACAERKKTVRGSLVNTVTWAVVCLVETVCLYLRLCVPTSCQRSVSGGSPRWQWGQVCVWSGTSWFLCPQHGPSLPHKGRHVEWEDQATPKWGRGSVW